MKAYLLTSGTLFFLLVLAHVARIIAEGVSVAASPIFAGTTAAAALMTAWSWRLFRRTGSEAAS